MKQYDYIIFNHHNDETKALKDDALQVSKSAFNSKKLKPQTIRIGLSRGKTIFKLDDVYSVEKIERLQD